jgi:hypothetical protein
MFTPLKIYNETPEGRLNRDLRETLPINESKGKPPMEVCPILNLHRCKFGRLSHFLDYTKRKEIVSFLLERKKTTTPPIFKVYQAPTAFTAVSFELLGPEQSLKYLNMVRKGRLVLLANIENRWDAEENLLEYRIHMDMDTTTLNIHLAKVDKDDSDFPLTILRDDADLFLYTLG